ncbi:hypothetical protein CRG98_010035 [Punica granatum]|uniref:Uncharacterized protein n=1 Tax=Punica granatum TaxID=22663 RepID=A0A2I0KM62_PUNGR|nr:hypothetical protein CRG98_010035 [Punica granatum]
MRLKTMYKQFTELLNHIGVGWRKTTTLSRQVPMYEICLSRYNLRLPTSHNIISIFFLSFEHELEFLIISIEKYDESFKKNKAFKTFRARGCKHYLLLNELFNASTVLSPRPIDRGLQMRNDSYMRNSYQHPRKSINNLSTSKKASTRVTTLSRFKSLLYLSPDFE